MLRPLTVALLIAVPVLSQLNLTADADEADSPKAKMAKSVQAWEGLKATCKGNYTYSIRWSSWVGFGHETTIIVRDNKVAQRKYREWSGRPQLVEPGKPPKPEGASWTETADEVGSHKKGAPPKTLDELYADAQKILDTKLEPSQRLYVRFDKQGLLLSCFYVDTRIADDAPQTGVSISNISLETDEQ